MCVLLICTLVASWDTFCIVVSSIAPNGAQFIYKCHRSEEIHRKIYAYHTCRRCISLVLARTNNAVKAILETITENVSSRTKPRKKNVECHYNCLEGHFKNYCYALTIKEKENIKARELIDIRRELIDIRSNLAEWSLILYVDRGNKYNLWWDKHIGFGWCYHTRLGKYGFITLLNIVATLSCRISCDST